MVLVLAGAVCAAGAQEQQQRTSEAQSWLRPARHQAAHNRSAAEAAGQRLDQFIASQLEGVSRSRVQMLMDQGDVLVNGEREKASLKLRGGERIASQASRIPRR